MGIYDRVLVDSDVPLPKFPPERDPSELTWQSKDLGRPAMQTYRITAEGRLLRQETERREKTTEEKRSEAKEHGFESWEDYIQFCKETDPEQLVQRGIGMGIPRDTTVVERFWVDHNMHGSFEFHASDKGATVGDGDGFYWSFEARFNRGALKEIVFLGERGGGTNEADIRPDEPISISF